MGLMVRSESEAGVPILCVFTDCGDQLVNSGVDILSFGRDRHSGDEDCPSVILVNHLRTN